MPHTSILTSLKQLLRGFAALEEQQDIEISGIASDSRAVQPNYVFFASQGKKNQRNDFINDALQRGASAVVVDAEQDVEVSCDVPVIRIKQLSKNLGLIASRYYGDPSSQLKLIGITGTNGKTSCSHLLAQCLDLQGYRCGIIGTMGCGFYEDLQPVANTTPGPIELQSHLYALLCAGADHVVMEVSSHGLEQFRTVGCEFNVAVFTNLSRDHLDYHGSMEVYGAAKLKLFAERSLTAVIVNLDDDFATRVVDVVAEGVTIIGVSLEGQTSSKVSSSINGKIIDKSLSGTRVAANTSWGGSEFFTHLLGDYNVSNALLVLAVILYEGESLEKAMHALQFLKAPKGRLESFTAENKALVVVDYAHTPDALEKVLHTLQAHTAGDLWVVFGCGGDRDKGKRPQMGRIAEKFANHICLTDDNPRSEPSAQIIDDILQGIQNPAVVIVEPEREAAIRRVITAAAANDIVLIAGKGHEDYQIVGDQVIPFSDRDVVSRVLEEVA